MATVIGYEGKRQAGALVSWGSAAITTGDQLKNGITGTSCSYSEPDVSLLASTGSLTVFSSPLKIDDDASVSPLVVLETRRSANKQNLLRLDPGRIGGLVTSQPLGEYYVYVFDSPESFECAAQEIVGRLLHELLYKELTLEQREEFFGAGFVLCPHHPGLNAARVVFSEDKQLESIVAEASLRKDEDKALFRRYLEGLLTNNLEYSVKYDDGIAFGGGMNVDHAEKILGAVHSTHPHLSAQVESLHPFLDAAAPSRLHELKAASATFTFRASVESETLGARLARYLELQLLQDTLNGNPPQAIAQSRTFREAIAIIGSPDVDTQVTHRGINCSTYDDVVADAFDDETDPSWSEPLTVLGYQAGLVRDAGVIEVSVFPNLRMNLPTNDNGDGDQPDGLTFLEDRDDFLFKPALYTVIRQATPGKSEAFYLRRIERIKIGAKGRITAIPSSVVNGGWVQGLDIPLHWACGNELHIGDSILTGAGKGLLPDARKWMNQYQAFCLEQELNDLRRSRLAPPKMPGPSRLIDVLIAVTELGGEAHQRDVVATMNRSRVKPMRINNTRRVVIHNPVLLEFAESNDQVIATTEKGKRYLQAYRAIARRA